MIAASLFSGIGAPEVAMPGWQWAWHAEIEKFPSAVMAAHYPENLNFGDVAADYPENLRWKGDDPPPRRWAAGGGIVYRSYADYCD